MFKTLKTVSFIVAFFIANAVIAQSLQKMIPKDATIVFSINAQHLNNKVNLLELTQFPFYDMALQQISMMGGSEGEMATIFMTEPSKFGLDLMKEAFVFTKMEDNFINIGVAVELTDQEAFTKFLKEYAFPDKELSIEKVDGFNRTSPIYDLIISWNDKFALFSGVEKQNETYYDDEDYLKGDVIEDSDMGMEEWQDTEEIEIIEEEIVEEAIEEEEEEINFEEPQIEEDLPASLEDITNDMSIETEGEVEFDWFPEDPEIRAKSVEWTNAILNLDPATSISTNNRFTSRTATNDMHVWVDYDYFMQKQLKDAEMSDILGEYADNPMLMSVLNSLYQDMDLSVGMNFNKGEWLFQMDYFTDPKWAGIWSSSYDSKLNKKMLRYLNGEDLYGIFHMNMSTDNMIEGYKRVMKSTANELPMIGSMAESGLEILGLFIDEGAFSKLFEGEMIIAMTGMETIKSMETVIEYDDNFNGTEVVKEVEKENPGFVMLWSYKDKEAVRKFLDIAVKANALQQQGNQYNVDLPEFGNIDLLLKDDMMLITNSNKYSAKNFAKGFKKKQRISKEVCQLLEQYGASFYFDVPKIITKVAEENMPGGQTADLIDVVTKYVESYTFHTLKQPVNGAYRSELSVNFKNKNENILKQYFRMMDEMMNIMMGGAKS